MRLEYLIPIIYMGFMPGRGLEVKRRSQYKGVITTKG